MTWDNLRAAPSEVTKCFYATFFLTPEAELNSTCKYNLEFNPVAPPSRRHFNLSNTLIHDQISAKLKALPSASAVLCVDC